MKVIFERETEIGKCITDRISDEENTAQGNWVALACTAAATSGSKGMLRIEQRCYLRSTDSVQDVRSQDWVKPEMTLEPAAGSKQDTLKTVEGLHARFVENARQQLAELSILAPVVDSVQPASVGED